MAVTDQKQEATMFSARQKREIASAVQKILRDTAHPELPETEITFSLYVDGATKMSWADIKNNGAITEPSVNPWNESQDKRQGEATNEPIQGIPG